jgi:hypothetical protein
MRLCFERVRLEAAPPTAANEFRLYRWLKNSLLRRQRCPAAKAEIDFARLTTWLEAAPF